MKKRLFFYLNFLVVLFLFHGFSGCGGSSSNPNLTKSPISPFSLRIAVTGVGEGKVTSNVKGVECTKKEGVCQKGFDATTSVTLKAEPETGYIFLGWYEGACYGKASTCEVNVDQTRQVKAAFTKVVYVALTPLNAEPFPLSSIWTVKTDGSEKTAVIQLKSASAEYPVWSPDGTQIAYHSNRRLDGVDENDGNYHARNIWIRNLVNNTDLAVTRLVLANNEYPDAYHPVWSPDGTKILYSSTRAFDQSLDKTEPNIGRDEPYLWIASLNDGSHLPISREPGFYNYSRWSFDGKKVFYYYGNYSGVNALEMYEVEGDQKTSLIRFRVAQIYTASSTPYEISADHNKVFYLSNSRDGTDVRGNSINLWAFDLNDKTQTALTHFNQATVSQFSASPKENKIAYVTDRTLKGEDQISGTMNLWLLDLDQKTDLPLTELSQGFLSVPQFSPDGKKVLYYSNHDLTDQTTFGGDGNYWVVDLENKSHHPLAPLNRWNLNGFIGWLPDSQNILIAFENGFNHRSNAGRVNTEEKTFTSLFSGEHLRADRLKILEKKIYYSSYIATRDSWLKEFDVETKTERTLVQTNPKEYIGPFSVSPDQRQIVYLSDQSLGKKDQKPGLNLWLFNLNNNQNIPLTSLTQANAYYDFNWSPDGQKIYYISDRSLDVTKDELNRNGAFNVWVIDLKSGTQVPITKFTAKDVSSPDFCTWTKNSKKLICLAPWALAGFTEETKEDNLWILDPEGKEDPKSLTSLTESGVNSFVLSSEKELFYISNRALDGSDSFNQNKADNLWKADIETGINNPTTSLTGPRIDFSTTFASLQIAADGKKLFYSSSRPLDGSNNEGLIYYMQNLWEMDLDTSVHKPLTQFPESDQFGVTRFEISPDGKKAFLGRAWSGNYESWDYAVLNLLNGSIELEHTPALNDFRRSVQWISETDLLSQRSYGLWYATTRDFNSVRITPDIEYDDLFGGF